LKKCAECYSLIDTTTSTVVKDTTIYKHDTVIYYLNVPPDTSIQVIQIVCDSTGTATIKTSTTTNGNRSRTTSNLINNELTITSTCLAFLDSIELLNTTIQNIKSEVTTHTIPKPIFVPLKLSWWERIKQNYGGWAIIGWALLVLFFIGRKFLKAWLRANVPLSGISRWF
jgi:hypothetical protein